MSSHYQKGEYKFNNTYCSQCAGVFGPGNDGYSTCDQHEGRKDVRGPTKERMATTQGEEIINDIMDDLRDYTMVSFDDREEVARSIMAGYIRHVRVEF